MPNLKVRKIDGEVYRRLKLRAEEHGVSVEEEVRQLITQAVSAPQNLGELAREIFDEEHGVDLELPPRELPRPVEFDG
jgi:plasmid stability protein